MLFVVVNIVIYSDKSSNSVFWVLGSSIERWLEGKFENTSRVLNLVISTHFTQFLYVLK